MDIVKYKNFVFSIMPKKERSIERDIEAFCGWDFLLDLVNAARSTIDKALVAGLFLTGCRISELILLKPEQFNLGFDKDFIIVERCPVLKRYSRKERKSMSTQRTFPIRRDEPLVPYLVNAIKNPVSKLLFPYTRQTVFLRVRAIGRRLDSKVPFSNIHSSQIYPHWFRAQRARQLRYEYGFSDEELRDWFGWKVTEAGMPAIYGKLSCLELMKKMRESK